jgi:hypothetical protein
MSIKIQGGDVLAIEPIFRGFNILHKTVKFNGLDIFYREAGSKMLFQSSYFTGSPLRLTCFET